MVVATDVSINVRVHEFDEMMLMGQLWYCAHVLIPKDLFCFGASPACSLGWVRRVRESCRSACLHLVRLRPFSEMPR